MSLETKLANLFGLHGEDAWRRHANPWSVYTRIPIPLLLVAAIWSRASRSVTGETVWGRRKETPLPPRHRVAPVVLSVVSAAGLPFLIWGLVGLDPWVTAFGVAVQMAGKLWFLDRMALLYDDVSSAAVSVPPRTDQ
jgi:hypothetical protein